MCAGTKTFVGEVEIFLQTQTKVFNLTSNKNNDLQTLKVVTVPNYFPTHYPNKFCTFIHINFTLMSHECHINVT